MTLARCNNGHFFDSEKYESCPICAMQLTQTDFTANDEIASTIEIFGNDDIQNPDYESFDFYKNMLGNKTFPTNNKIISRIMFRLINWLFQSVLFSLIPFIFSILIHGMLQIDSPFYDYIRELFSYTLILSITNTIELTTEKYNGSGVKEILLPAHLLLTLIFSMLYGAIEIIYKLEYPLNADLSNFNQLLIVICLSYFVIGLLLQILGGLYDQ